MFTHTYAYTHIVYANKKLMAYMYINAQEMHTHVLIYMHM